MGFLEDYGRSGASESIDKIPRLAVELGKLQTEASGQRFKAAVDLKRLGMEEERVGLEGKRVALEAERTAASVAASEQQTRRAKLEADELQKKTEWLNRSGKLEMDPTFLRLSPGQQEQISAYAKSKGLIDEKGEITTRSKLDLLHELNTNTESFDKLMRQPAIKEAEAAVSAAYDELQNEKAKGAKANQDKIAELTANVNKAAKNYGVAKGNLDKTFEDVKQQGLFEQRMKELRERGNIAIRVAKEKGTYTRKLQDDLTKAMKGVAAAESAIFRLKSAGGLSPEMAAMFPQVAEIMKSGNKDAAIASLEALKRRYDDQIKALGGAAYYNKPESEDDVMAEIKDYE